MSSPKNCHELMVWERLFAAILPKHLISPDTAAAHADNAFEEWAKRQDAMMQLPQNKDLKRGDGQ